MTALAIGASATINLSDGGFVAVATNGGFAAVAVTPNVGDPSSVTLGPSPVRQVFGPYAEGAVVVLTNATANAMDYDAVGAATAPDITAGNGKRYGVVAGVIRNFNDGQGWRLIQAPEVAGHSSLNISAVSNDTSTITVSYTGMNVKSVVSFSATPDETLTKNGVETGASVGLTGAAISLRRQRQVGDYVSYNGSAWVSTNNVFTGAFASSILTLTHESVSTASMGSIASATSRDGVYIAALGTTNNTTTQVKFFDYAGVQIATPDTNMKVYVNRGMAFAYENPNNINEGTMSGANIWLYGIFELN